VVFCRWCARVCQAAGHLAIAWQRCGCVRTVVARAQKIDRYRQRQLSSDASNWVTRYWVVPRRLFGNRSSVGRFGEDVSGYPQGSPSRKWFHTMSELEQLARDVRGFAIELRQLGYSPVSGGHENRFIELSERMLRRANQMERRRH
jgi:hypothetical protein